MPPPDSPLPISLATHGVEKRFGPLTALRDVSLDFAAGTMHGVIGPEGAGKTTLMRILLNLLKPSAGRVEFRRGGVPVDFEEIRPLIAYMPQQQSLYADLSIGEHLDFFRALYGVADADYRARKDELLRITRLGDFLDRPAGKLSGGMYKKLGLMCALLRSPRVILLDEPTNGVDPISRREFWELLYRLADQQILILVTTAYMDEAERCARVHLLEQGQVVASGEPRELLLREGVRSFDELFLRHSETTSTASRRSETAFQSFAAPSSGPSEKTRAELAVEVRDLTVRFGDFKAVDHVSFSVSRGEIFGFLGANGAGKTTTIRVLCGLLTPSDGYVRVAGTGFDEGERAIKSKVGYMSQKFTLYNDLTVEENLNFIASLRKIEPKTYLRRRQELFELISFDKPLDSKVMELPGGIKQQVSLAAALLHDPEIIFLDEPTAGVTPASRARFWTLIREIAGRGKTVFVTTHYMDEAEQCGRIALMRTGELIALDTPAGLKKAAFPMPMFEFDPREKLSFQELSKVQHGDLFSFFEPYGLRFHASIVDRVSWERARPGLEKTFRIREIPPTLEDVFIREVEDRAPGKKAGEKP
jgi:ABC-2 type transport system ATP-binding protein